MSVSDTDTTLAEALALDATSAGSIVAAPTGPN